MIRRIRYLSLFVKKIFEANGAMIAQSGIHPSHRQIEFSLLIVHDNKSVDIITFLGHFGGFFGIGI
jgi:hypothetical protein